LDQKSLEEKTMKKLLLVLALAVAFATILAACGGGDDEGDSSSDATEAPSDDSDDEDDAEAAGDADAGEDVFTATCAGCHGADAEGIDGVGKPLADSDYVADTSSADLVIVVTGGRTVDDPLNTTGIIMPPKGGNPALTDEDIADVVAYIKSLN
jgi:mono/diheme cytochrome c family protein